MTKPVDHKTDDYGVWKNKWSADRKPQALDHGAKRADEFEKLKVKHEMKDPIEFEKHVKQMELDGKRKEMGAQNSPL